MIQARARPVPLPRAAYWRFVALATRWGDNDVFGHLNNAVYYAFFDTAVNQILIEAGVLDPVRGSVIGLVVETRCTYFESIAFPDPVEVGVRVDRLGCSSVRYGVGVFARERDAAAAQGEFTHVYVDRATRRPVEIPLELRAILSSRQPKVTD